jgi:hypothetical protein
VPKPSGFTLAQRFKLLLFLVTVDPDEMNCEAMFEPSERAEADASINKNTAWVALIKFVSETPLTPGQKEVLEKTMQEAGAPLLNNAELKADRMDAPITASMADVKASATATLRMAHDLADYMAKPPASGMNCVDEVNGPWKVLSRLYQSDGPSEVALFAFYVSDKGTSKNFIALSHFINTNTDKRHGKAETRAAGPGGGPGKKGGRAADKWAEPTEVFTAMGTSGLVTPLSVGELRPADESALWTVLDSVAALAESEPPAQESAQAARKRKLAKLTHVENCHRIERHLKARAKARAKEDADEDEEDEEDEDEEEDDDDEE